MIQLTPDEVILGCLHNEAAHGYQLLEHFRDENRLGGVWHLSTSQLYAVLKRLEKNGTISGTQHTSPDAPPRTEYALTEAGREALFAWLDEPKPSPSVRRVRVELLSRIYVARRLGHPIGPIIERQVQTCRQRQAMLQDKLTRSAPGMGRMSTQFVLAQIEAILNWIVNCSIDEWGMQT